MTVAEVKEVMDDAIRHSQKASAEEIDAESFWKKYRRCQTVLILSEKDFNI